MLTLTLVRQLAAFAITKIKRCLKEIVEWKHRESLGVAPAQLLDAIKFWSRHLNDPTTPDQVRALLDKLS